MSETKEVKFLDTGKYAEHKPYLPQLEVKEVGEIHTVSVEMAESVTGAGKAEYTVQLTDGPGDEMTDAEKEAADLAEKEAADLAEKEAADLAEKEAADLADLAEKEAADLAELAASLGNKSKSKGGKKK